MIRKSECRLRPIAEGDLELIRAWRNLDRIRSVMFTSETITPEGQRRWFDSLAGDRTRAYFVFEVSGRPVGVVNFNPIDPDQKVCAWGFYRGADDAPVGTGRAMGFLGLEKAFDGLAMRTVLAETFRFNATGIRFHLGLGFVETGERSCPKDGRDEKVAMFQFSSENWKRSKATLQAAVFPNG